MKFFRLVAMRFFGKTRFCWCLAALALSGCAAQSAYREGRTLWAEGRPQQALVKLEEATRLDPGSAHYRLSYLQLREQFALRRLQIGDDARDLRRWEDSERIYRELLDMPGQQERALVRLRDLDHARRSAGLQAEIEAAVGRMDWDAARDHLRRLEVETPHWPEIPLLRSQIERKKEQRQPPITLSNIYRQPISLEFKDVPIRTVFDVIARSSGLNFVFDKEIRADQRASIYLRDSTVEAALSWLLRTNQLEQRVLDGKSLLIFPASPSKQSEYQPLLIKSFYLTNAEAKTVATTLKAMLKSKDVIVDEKLNLVMMRDRPEAIRLAEKVVALQDVPEPEVMLEVEILEVSRSRLLDLGISWPDQAALTLLPSGNGGTLTLEDLRNPRRNNVGVSVGSTTINAKKQDTDSNLLANPRIRTRNHEKAKILIGDRVPNITTNWSNTGFAGENINYVEVGLKLEVEPTIFLDDQVAIKLALEVSSITGQQVTKNGSVAYQIGTRTAQTVLRLKDGENQVLAGLINADDRRSANKVPGLGEIPILGRLFGQNSDNATKTEILLSITPRVLRNVRRPDAELLEFEAGTETNLQPWPVGLVPSPPQGLPASSAGGATQSSSPLNTRATNTETSKGNQLSWQAPVQVRPGEVFTTQLMLRNSDVISNLPLAIGFDPKAVQVVNVAPGALVPKRAGAFTQRVDPAGQILVMTQPAPPQAGIAATTIMEVTMRALPTAAGDSFILQVIQGDPVDTSGRAVTFAPLPQVSIGLNRQL